MARYVIRVNYPDGAVAWLRHGSVVGTGPIVRFPNRKTAEVNLDFIREGLDTDVTASVVKVADRPRARNAGATSSEKGATESAPRSSSSTSSGG